MALKLGKIDTAAPKDLRVTLHFKGAIAQHLTDYHTAYNAEHGTTISMDDMVAAMVEQFVSDDPGFRRAQRARTNGTTKPKKAAAPAA